MYRINVLPGSTELFVRKGRIVTADGFGEVAKGGKKLIFSKDSVVTAKLDKKDQDDFDIWSKQRAETLARANEKLASRAFNTYLSSFNNSWRSSFGRFPDRLGFWAFSPFSSCYTFVPFYYGWPSPYGHYYGSYYGVYNYSNGGGIVSTPPSSSGSYGGFPGGSASGSGGSSAGSGGSTGSSGGSPSSAPSPPAPMPQAGPRDHDSGGRYNNRIKDPIK